MTREISINTPEWALPLLEQETRYKGAFGGRGGGKSHFFAEMIIERHLLNPETKTVCIREVQKSMRHSVKALVEAKIQALQVGDLFEVQRDLILNKTGTGMIIFQGMQDHTAESIKSLEGIDIAWIEEAQSVSKRSLDLLIPTIRKDKSQIWATWNPGQESDPIDQLLRCNPEIKDKVIVKVNLHDNPYASEVLWQEYESAKNHARRKFEAGDKNAWAEFEHIWHGEYLQFNDAQVLAGHYSICEQKPDLDWYEPFFGADWGFSSDPTTLVRCFLSRDHKNLYIDRELYGKHIETTDLSAFFSEIPDSEKYIIRADNSRPEVISHLKRHGFPKIRAAEKWSGSVKDGISFLRGLEEIFIHSSCKNAISEASNWKYKVNRLTGEVTSELESGNDHIWDAVRYALEPAIRNKNLHQKALIAAHKRTF